MVHIFNSTVCPLYVEIDLSVHDIYIYIYIYIFLMKASILLNRTNLYCCLFGIGIFFMSDLYSSSP